MCNLYFVTPRNEVCEGYVFTGVCLSTRGGGAGGIHDGLHAWQKGGMHGGGHVWWGACVAVGHVWWGACVVGGVYGRGHAWQGT